VKLLAPALLTLATVVGGCSGGDAPEPPAAGSPAETAETSPPTPTEQAEPEVAQVAVDGLETPLQVEVARTPSAQGRGLMGRTELPAGTGMLFVWPEAANRTFWMRDTLIPLDIAWIQDGRVRGVTSMQPCEEAEAADCERYPSPGPVDAAIEAAPGTFAGVETGAQVDVREG
jgi:uncharacterized protein